MGSESNSVSVLWGLSGPSRSFSTLRRGKESKSMDINEPSLMDVAHDTINSTQGPALIEVAYFPSSEGKGRAFFVVIVGGSHEIYTGRRNQTKVKGPFDSLRGIAAPSPGAISGPSSRRAGHA
ncbi:hypothetical protein A4A49_55758 [Nicotiana attenuata]|uniref:Uncharacterized protein n=1 Tax=Nicotiana attenuata TaxID=49451 RepID=A0A1J6K205_NICAT|nr:hypothetical protein A4A49_55758 [Nicotiana attenuata]